MALVIFILAGMAMSSFEIGGMAGSILVGIITDRWMQKVCNCKRSAKKAFIMCLDDSSVACCI